MLVRMTPTRSVPWLRVFVEGVVIVGSILLAFGIDAWWEGRQERQEAEQQVELLGAEMVRNRDLLQLSDSFARNARTGLDTLIAAMSPTPTALSLDSVQQLLRPGLGMADLDFEMSALESVLASDLLDLRRDSALHRQMVEFRAQAGMFSRDVARFVDVRERVTDHLLSIAPGALMGGDEATFPVSVPALLSDAKLQALLGELRTRHTFRMDRAVSLGGLIGSTLHELGERGR